MSFDPDEPGVMKRVHRGGSFLCTDEYCSRYMVGTRGKGDVERRDQPSGIPLRELSSAENRLIRAGRLDGLTPADKRA